MRNPTGSLALLVAEDLAVGYGDAPVCAPVDVRLAAGRALAVVGPNGSGKSTLLRTLVGLLEPLAGAVTFDGLPVDERSAGFRRDVAAVLDDDAFFASLTGREHLLLAALGHGVPAAADVVDAEVAAFGLGDRADALPSALSSGQRRRLALAAAFVRPARLLVLDEPERRLDAGMRVRLATRLAALRDAGTAVLFASHDAEVVGSVADQVLVVDDDACRLLAPAEAAGRIPEL
ncbi:ABC-type multidrug transport system, ATPase component [Geodermatophilus pulveris]|uniref:ABC-type multidrug transport system, ATPase component n=1 Tax=Geodermatophilus pulveris TaxID=1564159 RepID=A0A239C974_9ACTN|nr:ABC transporter ATP-binding protein [Geodermatophilus pulveris]SNS16785.1 ABC-type multidrug transport system, ATPase component [Geodermatophilus pulveris]